MLQAHYKDLHAVRPKCEKLEDHMTLGVSFLAQDNAQTKVPAS